MSEKISWSFNGQIGTGPKIGVSGNLDIDAYDVVKVVIGAVAIETKAKPGEEGPPTVAPVPAKAAAAVPVTVQIQPGSVDEVQFLLIQSSVYSKDLTYKVTGVDKAIALDQMHLLMGSGAVGMLGKAPQSLVFSNAIVDSGKGEGTEVSIQIYVGRKATA